MSVKNEELTSLLRSRTRTLSPPPDGLGLSWSGVVYDVKAKKAPVATHQNVLCEVSTKNWEKAFVEKMNPDGTAEVRIGSAEPKTIPLDRLKPNGRKRILKGVAGNINNGRLCCIMGPSGAGKSSLLNLLAGRVATGINNVIVEGSIMLDNKPLNPVEFRNSVAYVTQEDALFATQTPYEALQFSAKLRNPSLSVDERERLVRSTLSKLRLEKCADTFTGNAMIPGLSGGEKKRTAIGIELVANPQYLFLDEPTSGLDSYAAWMVVDLLKQLANGQYDGVKRTVVATIHQPSSEVFQLFEDVILVNDGRGVYNGPVAGLPSHFEKAGYPIEGGHNPADHVMFCMQLEAMWLADANRLEASQGDDEDLIQDASGAPQPKQLLADYWLTVASKYSVTPTAGNMLSTEEKTLSKQAKASFATQFYTLGTREMANLVRDKGSLIARFGSTIFLNLIVGLVFRNVGSSDKGWTQPGLQAHFGGLAQISIGGMFGLAQPMLLSFPLERPVFLREYATGTYSAAPYFLSKLMVEVPMSILQSLALFLTAYWLMDLQGVFPYLVLATALLGLVSASVALLIGSISANAQTAIQLSPLIFVPQILFAGIFIPNSQIPSFLRWAQYLCSLKYGINLLTIAEFKTIPFEEGTIEHENASLQVDALMSNLDITPSHEWTYFLIMCAVFVGFRMVAFVVLAKKGSTLQA